MSLTPRGAGLGPTHSVNLSVFILCLRLPLTPSTLKVEPPRALACSLDIATANMAGVHPHNSISLQVHVSALLAPPQLPRCAVVRSGRTGAVLCSEILCSADKPPAEHRPYSFTQWLLHQFPVIAATAAGAEDCGYLFHDAWPLGMSPHTEMGNGGELSNPDALGVEEGEVISFVV